jgi:hypothetical protein
MRYALTETATGNIREYRMFDEQPPLLNESKGVQWILSPLPAPVPPTLDELKANKRAEINQQRAELETAGFSYLGHVFDSDQRSADRIQVATGSALAALMAGQPYELAWTAADNTDVPLDAAGVVGLNTAFAVYGLTLHETAKALKAQVDAATTAGEVEAIAWPV